MSHEHFHQRVTVMGLGRHGGGAGVARYLARRGAIVTISDCAGAADLREPVADLAGVPIQRWSLGGHRADDFDGADLVVVNPAIKPANRWLQYLADSQLPTTSEIEIFLGACPARVIAVTGSVGKSTTASLVAHVLNATGRRAWLGGNIGGSLLDEIDQIDARDWVVLELSSFQLARLNATRRPIDIAVILNCHANHLDWHGTFDDYRRAKQRLLALQDETCHAILNPADPEVASWRGLARCPVVEPVEIAGLPPLALPGEHQRQNVACAVAAALSAGCERGPALEALASFQPLAHRLELVGEVAGRRFYDDSKATTPEATLAALAAIEGPVWLLVGGQAKGADFGRLAASIARRACGAACFGAAGFEIHQRILVAIHDSQSAIRNGLGVGVGAAPAGPQCCLRATLDAALDWCVERSAAGDAILLSPACASLDQYADYVARAEHFRACVAKLSAETLV